MAYEVRDNSGSMFPNNKKVAENHADLQGSIRVGGVDYWINGWNKKTNNGLSWISLSVKEKVARPVVEEPETKTEDINDEIPF